MAIEVVMPALGLTMTEGMIQTWLKRVGESVAIDEPLFIVETDKAAQEVLSPAAGVLLQIVAAEGASAPVRAVIAYLGEPGEKLVEASPVTASPPTAASAPLATSVAAHPPANGGAAVAAVARPPVAPAPRGIQKYPAPTGGPEREQLLWMYRAMARIRAFDERIVRLFTAGRIAGALHSYVGEEAVAAGVCVNLRPDDYIVSTHRGHGHLLAKGGDMNRMMAELFGRIDGYCRGKGGSMHITDVSLGILGANGIVGAGLPIASGAGTAIRLQGGDQVVVCFFGDGASNIGTFHEGINLASTWGLPIVFVCENNGYAQFTPQRMHAHIPDLFQRSQAYGIPGIAIDGNDAVAVAEATGEAIARARRGEGPSLVEAKTFRWYGHAINNPASAIGRDQQEIDSWKAKDPLPRLAHQIVEIGLATTEELAAIRGEADRELEDSITFAEASPHPAPTEALDHVYTELPAGAEL